MEVKIANTIQDIDEQEWETLTGSDYIEQSHGWLRTVEDSGMRDMQYIFVREDGKLVAAACCYAFTEMLYKIKMPLLEVRSPLGTSMGLFSQTPEHTDVLVKELEQIQAKEKTKGILIYDLRNKNFDIFKNQMKRFTVFQLEDNTYLDLHFSDFEDYLSSLNATARRSIRFTLNKTAKKWKIKTVFTTEFSKWKEVAHRLQGYICEQFDNYEWHLTEQFYEALEKNFKDNAEMVIFSKGDIPIVFGLALNSPDTVLYKFVGIDPAYREYQAYFLIYYEGIKRAIERGQKRIYFGPSTYTFKERIGCKREELFGLARLKNPLLHQALRSLITAYKVLGKKF